MSSITRRQFSSMVEVGAVSLMLPPALLGQVKPRVVIVGGGAGGATAARYLAKDSAGLLDVTLVEDTDTYTTCFYSNLYLGGFRTFESNTHSYDTLASDYDITIKRACCRCRLTSARGGAQRR